jgi:hypothetical protein
MQTRKLGSAVLRTRGFVYDKRGNIKQDIRTPYASAQAGTTKTYQMNYGNSDRLDGITAPAP